MTDYELLYGDGEVRFYNGTFTTEDLYWVLGYANADRLNFSGSDSVYDLNPVFAMGQSSWAVGSKGSADLVWLALGAFKDFAIYTAGDPISSGAVLTSDGNVNSGNVGDPWKSHYKTFIPPSGTAFVVPHIQFQSVPNNTYQYVDNNQMEVIPVATSAVSSFAAARQVCVNVRASAINYVTNPSGVTNTTNWTNATQLGSAIAPTTYTKDQLVPNPDFESAITGWNTPGTNTQSTAEAQSGTHSMLVTWPTASGNQITFTGVSGLTPGQQYTFGAYVYVPTGSPAVRVDCLYVASSGWTTVNNQWVRLSCTFTATANTHYIVIETNGSTTSGQQVYVDGATAVPGIVDRTLASLPYDYYLTLTQAGLDPQVNDYVVSAYVWGNAQPVSIVGVDETFTIDMGNGVSRVWGRFSTNLTSTTVKFTSPATFNLNRAMITTGSTLIDYFDGNSGSDYLWENGGTPQASRSYYYPGRTQRNAVLIRNLEENLPLGISLNSTITYGSPPN